MDPNSCVFLRIPQNDTTRLLFYFSPWFYYDFQMTFDFLWLPYYVFQGREWRRPRGMRSHREVPSLRAFSWLSSLGFCGMLSLAEAGVCFYTKYTVDYDLLRSFDFQNHLRIVFTDFLVPTMLLRFLRIFIFTLFLFTLVCKIPIVTWISLTRPQRAFHVWLLAI